TPAQVGELLAAAEPMFRASIALGAFAGLRLGEVCGAQVGDIEWLARAFHVRRQVQGAETRGPKYGSERTVYIPDALAALLAQHVEQLDDGGDARWLFPSPRLATMPVSSSKLNEHWRAARTAAGVP